MSFAIPMTWRESQSHDDCYFCLCKLQGFNAKNKDNIQYPNVSSVTKPIPHGPEYPIPLSPFMRTEETDHAEDITEDVELDDTKVIKKTTAFFAKRFK